MMVLNCFDNNGDDDDDGGGGGDVTIETQTIQSVWLFFLQSGTCAVF